MWKSALVCWSALIQFGFADDVRLPPSLKEQPSEKIRYFRRASDQALPCAASGSGQLTYEWKKNGATLDWQRGKISRPDPTVGTIVITRADETDDGYYQCYVSNEYGKAMSIKTRLVCAVLEDFAGGTAVTPHTWTQYSWNKLLCNAPRSVPDATYYWVVVRNVSDAEFTKIETDRRMQMDMRGNLFFAWVIPEDAQNGKLYKCMAMNPITNLTTGGNYQTVTVTPTDIPQPQTPILQFRSLDKIGLEGKLVKMRCFFSGYPQPTIRWSRFTDDLPLERFTVTPHMTGASISNVQTSDKGVYVCTGTVANAPMRTTHSIQLTVEAEPRWIGQLKDINATSGDTVVIDCAVYAKPAPQYTWYRNTEELDINALPSKFSMSADRTNLTITNVQKSYPDCGGRPGDLMVIQCNASNKHGYAYKQVYVNVFERTVFTQAPKDVLIDHHGDQASFYAQANTDPSTPLICTWYFGNNKLANDSKYSVTDDGRNLTITGVEQSDIGEYRCEASNGVSTAIATAELKLCNLVSDNATIIIVLALWSVCSTTVHLITAVIYFRKRRQSNDDNGKEAMYSEEVSSPEPCLYEQIQFKRDRYVDTRSLHLSIPETPRYNHQLYDNSTAVYDNHAG